MDPDQDPGAAPAAPPAPAQPSQLAQALPVSSPAPAQPAQPAQGALPLPDVNVTASSSQPNQQQQQAPTLQPAYGAGNPQGASGQPPQAVATAQSEPTPQANKPPFDPRPYAWVAKHDPQLKGVIDDAASLTGVDPARIAWHAYKESGFQQDNASGKPLRGTSGEIGMMQLMPGTAQGMSEGGRLDPFDARDNILMGARYIAEQDARFGRNSPSSFAAYNGGPGGVNGDRARAYAASAFPGTSLSSRDFVGQGSMTPRGLVDAGTQGGPTGFLRYVVNTAPAGMPMSDAWRHAESLLVSSFLERGDMAGAQHAQDFVAQMSHVGSNQYLMAAHQALSAGDGVGAAKYLAKAHAFFPDGTIGRFRSDGKNVYAERLDENDPSQRVGSPFMVTANDVAGLLNQTTNPQQYLQTVRQEQQSVANARIAQQHGDYYTQIAEERERTAALRYQGQVEAAQTHAQATTDAATIRADALRDAANLRAQNSSGAGSAGHAATTRAIDKEADTKFNNLTSPDASPEQLGDMAEIYRDVRISGNGDQGLSPPQAERVARGLSDNTLQLIRLTDGNYGVLKADGQDRQPIAYISKAMGDRLAGAHAPNAQGQASPIGAGAGSPYARGAGISQNLTGTVMCIS
jgi:soluble lytic murein transglycosylase-like protein